MFIDNKGKLFGKISIIDIGVIILVILLAIGIGYRFFIAKDANSPFIMQNANIEYKVEVKAIKKGAIDSIIKKGQIYDSKDKNYIGDITNVEYEEAKEDKIKMDGTVVSVEIPERYDAIVTINCDGKVAIKGDRKIPYNGQNKEIHVGSTFRLVSKWIECDSKIKDVKVQ